MRTQKIRETNIFPKFTRAKEGGSSIFVDYMPHLATKSHNSKSFAVDSSALLQKLWNDHSKKSRFHRNTWQSTWKLCLRPIFEARSQLVLDTNHDEHFPPCWWHVSRTEYPCAAAEIKGIKECDWCFYQDARALFGRIYNTIFGSIYDFLFSVQLSDENSLHCEHGIYHLDGP